MMNTDPSGMMMVLDDNGHMHSNGAYNGAAAYIDAANAMDLAQGMGGPSNAGSGGQEYVPVFAQPNDVVDENGLLQINMMSGLLETMTAQTTNAQGDYVDVALPGSSSSMDGSKNALSASDTFTRATKFTFYDNCKKCTGKSPGDPGYGITKSGAVAGPGTLAGPSAYPFGTVVTWTDPSGAVHTGTIEDRGGNINGNRIDIWVPSHADIPACGTYTVTATFTLP